jgi:FtsH-binding integral membrane protein
MEYIKIILGSLAIASFVVLPIIAATTVLTQAPATAAANGGVTIDNPITSNSFEEFVGKIAKWLFNIALVIAPIMFVIGGFYYITAQGDPAKIKKAGDLITWTAIGLIVIMLTNGIIKLLKDMIV